MGGVILHAHLVRGESHIQRNTKGEVATVACIFHQADDSNWGWGKLHNCNFSEKSC